MKGIRFCGTGMLICILAGVFSMSFGGDKTPSAKAAFFEPSESIDLTAEIDGQLVRFGLDHPKLVEDRFSYQWDMGDGSTAKGRSPIHFYETPGDYLIKVEITDELGQSVEKQRAIKVEAPATFGYSWELFGSSLDLRSHVMVGGDPGFVAAAKTGQLLFSSNGFDWSPVDLFIAEDVISVHWIDNAFWALARGIERLDDHYLYYTLLLKSEDGKQWERQQDIPGYVNALFSDGTRLFAMGVNYPHHPRSIRNLGGEAGVIFRQDDQERWISEIVGGPPFVNQMYWNGHDYVALASWAPTPSNISYQLYTSSDGLAWEQREGEQGFEMATSGKTFLRVHDAIEVSHDALTWTEVDVDLPETMIQVLWGGNQFVAIGNRFAMASPDGWKWKKQSLPDEFFGSGLNLAHHRGLWLASDTRGTVMYSEDGLNWKKHPAFQERIRSAKWAHMTVTETGYAIASEQGHIRETTDGQTWTETQPVVDFRIQDLTQGPRGLAISGGRVNSGRGGLLLERVNGEWEIVYENESFIQRAIYKFGIWHLKVGGTMVQSGNRRDWFPLDIEGHLVDMISTDQSLIIRTTHKLFVSENGLDWTEMNVPIQAITAVTQKENLIVVAGVDGTDEAANAFVLLSTDGQEWEKIPYRVTPDIDHLMVHDERIYAFSNYVADGFSRRVNLAQAMASSADGRSWEGEKIHPGLTINDAVTSEQGFLILSENGSLLRQKTPDVSIESGEIQPSQR